MERNQPETAGCSHQSDTQTDTVFTRTVLDVHVWKAKTVLMGISDQNFLRNANIRCFPKWRCGSCFSFMFAAVTKIIPTSIHAKVHTQKEKEKNAHGLQTLTRFPLCDVHHFRTGTQLVGILQRRHVYFLLLFTTACPGEDCEVLSLSLIHLFSSSARTGY